MRTELEPAPAGGEARSPAEWEVESVREVFRYLDLTSLARAALVCRGWFAASQQEHLWDFGESELSGIMELGVETHRRATSLSNHYGGSSKERIEFLRKTLVQVREYAQQQLNHRYWKASGDLWLATRLLRSAFCRLKEISEVLQALEARNFTVTVNFDIFELAMRRCLGELDSMLPLAHGQKGSPSYPSRAYEAPDRDVPENARQEWLRMHPRLDVIADEAARAVWLEKVGPRCCCSFDHFYEKVLLLFPQAHTERFRLCFTHFFDFPRDNLMTTHRFHTFVSHFGPFPDVAANFAHYALGEGFVGLVNQIKAEEVFGELQASSDTVLIRFSRQCPAFLAFTSFNSRTRTLEHRRNRDRNGQPIPIATFLKEQYPGYVLAGIGVDDMAIRAVNTFVYARADDSYLTHTGH